VATHAEPPHQVSPRGGSGAMFDEIAHRYDLLNRILSFGTDQGWRRATIAALGAGPGMRFLDLATGTGDLALRLLRTHPDTTVVGLDPSARMLERARRKAELAGASKLVEWVIGDAEALPFDDASFDGVCMAFGIRNVPDRPRALREMARVTRAGGRVAILELSDPDSGWLRSLARLHVHRVVPRLGGWLSGAREYRYLAESIAAFPPPAEFASSMGEAGLTVQQVRRLTFGAAHLYVARSGGLP